MLEDENKVALDHVIAMVSGLKEPEIDLGNKDAVRGRIRLYFHEHPGAKELLSKYKVGGSPLESGDGGTLWCSECSYEESFVARLGAGAPFSEIFHMPEDPALTVDDPPVTSNKGMSPQELQRFVEKMGREGVDPATLTSGKLDRMIDDLHNEDEDLSNYLFAKLAVLRVLREGLFNNKDLGGDLNECRRLMDQARVIACRSALQDVLNHTDRFLRHTLGKEVDGKSATPLFEKELSDLARATVHYPEKLPFPSIYLSFGQGFHSYDTTQVADVLLGILVSEKAAWQFFTGGSGPVIIPVGVYHLGHWTAYCSKAPWAIVQLIDLINSYKSYVEEMPRSMKRRMAYEKLGKSVGLKGAIPPPYYRVKLHDVHIKERGEALFPTNRVLGHRHDRRGHERCKFRKGRLPMDHKLEAKLLERGYELFKQNPVDVGTFRRLSQRGLPYKAHDEWLAVKTTWVKDTIVGDESLPYVPSIHEVPSVGTQGVQ